ncbi:MAG: exosortase/archaeosortase family protein [Verrucomicrobiales bacterium]
MARGKLLPLLAVWLPVVLVWSGLLWRLRQEWAWSETYRYGFWVPLLVILLAARRCADGGPHSPAAPLATLTKIGIATGVAIFPCELIIRANPDWRVGFWLYGGVAFLANAFWLSAIGGWRWAVRFVPALGLLFMAIPWLSFIEQPIVQGLSRMVASSATETANLLGIPAVHEGNTIVLDNDVRLGVEDACSGLRSLQSAMMAAWFLGELVRLSWLRRLSLLAMGGLLAAGFNSLRAVLLIVAAANGTRGDALDSYHDLLGAGTAIALFASIAALTWGLSRRGSLVIHCETIAESPVAVPLYGAFSLVLACCVSMVAATLWFRQDVEGDPVRMHVDWEKLEPPAEIRGISSAAREMLRFSEGEHAVWIPKAGVRCDVFYLDWEPGQISSFANVHRPDICLPASGIELSENGRWVATAVGTDIAFETWRASGAHVFFSRWDGDRKIGGLQGGTGRLGRLKKALQGESIEARQSLEILVTGVDDVAEARAMVQQLVAAAVSAGSGPVGKP